MRSVGQARRQLPSEFVDRLYEIFPPAQADQVLRALASNRKTALRVNTLKTDTRSVMSSLRDRTVKFERVAWYDDALILSNATEKQAAAWEEYTDGRIYLQNPSSMIPPLVLNPKPGHSVLDMTAAPGSKTTQLAALMNNRGSILAVEKDFVRHERLQHNIRLLGASIVHSVQGDAERLGKAHPNTFDRVLLDAPCSGEGTFALDNSQTYRHWSLKMIRRSASLQRRLLRAAISAARSGGLVVYSTCTLAPEENEGVLTQVLEEVGDQAVIVPVHQSFKPSRVTSGLSTFGEQRFHPSVRHAVRILPSLWHEGFFCALLQCR